MWRKMLILGPLIFGPSLFWNWCNVKRKHLHCQTRRRTATATASAHHANSKQLELPILKQGTCSPLARQPKTSPLQAHSLTAWVPFLVTPRCNAAKATPTSLASCLLSIKRWETRQALCCTSEARWKKSCSEPDITRSKLNMSSCCGIAGWINPVISKALQWTFHTSAASRTERPHSPSHETLKAGASQTKRAQPKASAGWGAGPRQNKTVHRKVSAGWAAAWQRCECVRAWWEAKVPGQFLSKALATSSHIVAQGHGPLFCAPPSHPLYRQMAYLTVSGAGLPAVYI